MSDPTPVPGDQAMTLGDHLDTLRAHLLRGGKWVIGGFIGSMFFSQQLVAVVTWPHRMTMDALGLPPSLYQFTYQETFVVHLKLALFAGLFLGMPMLLRELWSFIAVGLYPTEKRYVRIITPLVSVSFVLGCMFGYFVMVPMGLRYLATYGDRTLIVSQIRLQDYVGLFLMLTLTLGLIFELPLVMWSLHRIGIFTAKQYASVRRYAILAAFILGAVLTPPDVISQLLMSIPMVVLYELGILLTGGVRATLGGGRLLAAAAVVLVLGGGWLTYDLLRVDWYLRAAGSAGNELSWEGGGDRPFTPLATGAAAKLLALADRAAMPAAARAAADPTLVPLAASLAAAAPPEKLLAPFLRNLVEDERKFVRERVAQALGRLELPEDDERLEQLRKDSDRAVSLTAAIALLERERSAGGFTLITLLDTGPDELRLPAEQALVAARGADAGSVDAWWSWYFATVARHPQGSPLALLDVLADLGLPWPPERHDPAIREQLAGLLQDEDPYVRSRAASLAPPDLLHALSADPDPFVRLAAANALVRALDYKGVPMLVDLVGNPHPAISRRAHQQLVEITGLNLPERAESWQLWWSEHAPTFRWR